MINQETILSNFDDKGTLLKWLKKVEDALQGDTLTNIEVVTESDYSMKLVLTFGDNSTIESPTFTNKGRGIVSIAKTSTNGLVDTYTITYTDDTTSTFNVTNATGLNVTNLLALLTAGDNITIAEENGKARFDVPMLMSSIVDADGHNRYIEGDIYVPTPMTDLGIVKQYGKWSLSGTHLMIVMLLYIPANTSIVYTDLLGSLQNVPTWILDKIYTTTEVTDHVIVNSGFIYKEDWQAPTTINVRLRKTPQLNINVLNNISTTEKSYLRIQFDLLIDAN